MKKYLILFIAFILALSVCGCGTSTGEADTKSTSSGTASSVNETSKITEEKALEIASRYWGVRNGDIDEATDFPYLNMPVESSNGILQ